MSLLVLRSAIIAIAIVALCTPSVDARALTFEERVKAQEAIEQVFWKHRIWPGENPGSKPPLSEWMPEETLRAHVRDYLQQSNALQSFWQETITDERLQAEVERMAAHSKDPAVLREIFSVLGNDPLLIAETLARPALADRLIRDRYASDSRRHAETRRAAEQAALSAPDLEGMKRMRGASYSEATWVVRRGDGAVPEDPGGEGVNYINNEEWQLLLANLAAAFGTDIDSLPVGRPGRLREERERFTIQAILSRTENSITTAAMTWWKIPFDTFWSREKDSIPTDVASRSGPFRAVAPRLSTCVDDTWRTPVVNLSSRPAQVWTGAEVIFWGRYEFPAGNGDKYVLATDTWSSIAPAPFPGFTGTTSVWTGTEMIVWSGSSSSGAPGLETNAGGRYNLAGNSWRHTSSDANCPSNRQGALSVWTGTDMFVWGGYTTLGFPPNVQYTYKMDGGRYRPEDDVWIPVSTLGAPLTRNPPEVWTGSEIILWGGYDGSSFANTGGRYSPAADSWTPTSTGLSVPSARSLHSALWTGSQMIVWGGQNAAPALDSGGRYTPATDSWLTISTGAGAPSARRGHSGLWTGSEMIIWGGFNGSNWLNTGGRFDPALGVWRPTSTGANAPAPGVATGRFWTGSEMIAIGSSALYFYCASNCTTVAPSVSPTLVEHKSGDVAHLSWSAVPLATAYDVVKGDLEALQLSGGNFTTSTLGCLVNDVGTTSIDDPAVPSSNHGFWYLVRGVNCGGSGSYDTTSSAQLQSRDVEIASSGVACP